MSVILHFNLILIISIHRRGVVILNLETEKFEIRTHYPDILKKYSLST